MSVLIQIFPNHIAIIKKGTQGMKKVILTVSMLLLGLTLWAQQLDEQKMQRDIEIAESILYKLFNSDIPRVRVYDMHLMKESRGFYAKGYGVILKTPNLNVTKQIIGAVNNQENEDDCDDCEEKRKNKSKTQYIKLSSQSKDSILLANKDKILSLMQTFIVDYGDLIGQLQPTDKLLLVYEKAGMGYVYSYSGSTWATLSGSGGSKRSIKISSEIQKSALSDYKLGKISKEELVKKIKTYIDDSANQADNQAMMDYEVFAGVLEKLLDNDNQLPYYSNRDISFNRLQGFGVIYRLNVRERNKEHDEYHFGPIIEKDGDVYIRINEDYYTIIRDKIKSKSGKEVEKEDKEKIEKDISDAKKKLEEKKKKSEEMMTQLVENLKNHLIEYGRLVKRLNSEEIIMLDIRISGDWADYLTDQKTSLQLTVKRSVLEAFDKGTISLKDAIAKIETKTSSKENGED